MESYIIRIYRRSRNIPHKLIGVAEKVGHEDKKAFTNLDELWEILNSKEKGRTISGMREGKGIEGK